MTNTLSFLVAEIAGRTLALTPCIDGEPLTELVASFERVRGFDDPAGGYGGLVPDYYNYGPLLRYFCGEASGAGGEGGAEIYVLGCECGEVGCWPLRASVASFGARYRWAAFRQPYRPLRDYAAFGPFEFDRWQYETAVGNAVLRLERAR